MGVSRRQLAAHLLQELGGCVSDALQGRVAGEHGQGLLSMVSEAAQLEGLGRPQAPALAQGGVCQPHAAHTAARR